MSEIQVIYVRDYGHDRFIPVNALGKEIAKILGRNTFAASVFARLSKMYKMVILPGVLPIPEKYKDFI